MAKFYIHFRCRDKIDKDDVGIDLPTLAEACEAALLSHNAGRDQDTTQLRNRTGIQAWRQSIRSATKKPRTMPGLLS